MLIRFVINNVFSFGQEKEFNMIPMPSINSLMAHKYSIDDFEFLKMSSIYGANGAGKSNLIQALFMLQRIVQKEKVPSRFANTHFKFNASTLPQTFVIEFIQDNKSFIYGIEILDSVVTTEELYLSGLGKREDILLYERKTDIDTKITTIVSDLFEQDTESKTLKKILEKNLSKPEKIIFRLLTTLDSEYLSDVTTALSWFDDTLQVITPNARPSALVHKIDTDQEFKAYTEDIMRSFQLGVERIECQKKTLNDFLGEDNQEKLSEIKEEINKSSKKLIGLRSKTGDEVIISKDNEEIFVKQLRIEHKGKNDKKAIFNLNEESDGTIRLLDFVPAFHDLVHKKRVFVIDEIERSIHPLLIKELVRKFSEEMHSQGQLIFTTHESNLLDSTLFRQDEIWFAEKNSDASTDLYSLSDFKKLNLLDIRKGYLSGRYGSIPFLANLRDLNWHNYDIEK
ncbi:ATP-binding protein [Candidatus Parabeggiatoa sp. HSG14]|uniref:AAA family ATPase n=1 Tax=Candidatus Parabeggiatoa sp. HSG14 TaxID=3055593 RepID=UPI0025A71D61|nr:ATP-binding protein [Thiotrichales bacterium HSG14]